MDEAESETPRSLDEALDQFLVPEKATEIHGAEAVRQIARSYQAQHEAEEIADREDGRSPPSHAPTKASTAQQAVDGFMHPPATKPHNGGRTVRLDRLREIVHENDGPAGSSAAAAGETFQPPRRLQGRFAFERRRQNHTISSENTVLARRAGVVYGLLTVLLVLASFVAAVAVAILLMHLP